MTAPRSTPKLEVIQRWMMSIITHPQGVVAGISSNPVREEMDVGLENIETVINPSQACSSIERLSVYGNAYLARLLECLEAEFPATQHAVGPDAFKAFAFGYLQQYPPTSYTLNMLGQFFPSYLAQSRPPCESSARVSLWTDFLIELAALERLYSEVFDGPGEERVSLLSTEMLRSIPAENWGEIRLITSASLRLFSASFPVHDYITSVRHGQEIPPPEPREIWLVVNRRNYIVRRQSVTQLQWRLLQVLQQQFPLGKAIEQTCSESDAPADELMLELGNWFQSWMVAGYFRGITDSAD